MAGDAQSISLQVQVIDLKPMTLELMVPTYLPAKDLTQRVARDAGLPVFWPDGRRRRYWIRARGRVVADEERLSEVGVIAGELIHLLPEPPHGEGVVERDPDYPPTRDYAASGVLALAGWVIATVLWAVLWGLALSEDQGLLVAILPALGMGVMGGSLARHMFGGKGGRVVIALAGAFIALLMLVLALLGPILAGVDVTDVILIALPATAVALLGVTTAWLAWWGAVEPLPIHSGAAAAAAGQATGAPPCGICNLPATAEVRMACQYSCGRTFHRGCYQARMAVAATDSSRCAVCGAGLQGG